MKLRRHLLVPLLVAIVLALVGWRYWRSSWAGDLKATVAHADRVRIRTGGVCHRREAEERTLFESTNAAEVSALIAMIDVTRPLVPMGCLCCGGPTFEFYAGDRLLAMLSRHHESGLRWPEKWSGDAHLTDDSRDRLDKWFAAQGIVEGDLAMPEDREQVPLDDTFVTAPEDLATAIRSVGGDPARVVRWFETERGPVWRFEVPGKTAVQAWERLRAEVERTRHWPLILGPNESIAFQNGSFEVQTRTSLVETLSKASGYSIADWLEEQRRARESFKREHPEYADTDDEETDAEEDRRPRGPWPSDAQPQDEYSTPLRLFDRAPHKSVWIGLAPTTDSTEIPALFNYGYWNDCPPPHAHVALHRDWQRRYGAEIVCLTNDVIEFRVSRPPTTREAAIALAEEQFDYCTDIVHQGVGTIEALAATLLNGPIWYFWWD